MKPIGGYFELELERGEHYHKSALKLNTARNCFEYVLRAKNYKKVYIPYYTCAVMLEPIERLNIEFEFYNIDEELNPLFSKSLQNQEALLYTNYFGLKQKTVEMLASKYKNNLIVDNVQAFFEKPLKGIDTFYSARKFLGVSDGAYLYTNSYLVEVFEEDKSYNRVSHLINRIECSAEEAYSEFVRNDNSLIGNPIRRMSKLTEAILKSINYQNIKLKRINNYDILEQHLKKLNLLKLNLLDQSVPMVYPFISSDKSLRKKLIANKIYVATYWKNVLNWTCHNQLEHNLVEQLIPLPIDQRYSRKDMLKIVAQI